MDKNAPQLDPKLKEAYDRVMGTSVNPPSQKQEAAPLPQNPTPQAPQQTVQSPSSSVQKAVASKKGGSKALIIFLVIIVFFIIYGLVWIKMFDLKVPFLNQ